MPRFYPSVLIADAYGSVGEVTFYHRNGKCYYRKRSHSRYPGTAAQTSALDVHRRALAIPARMETGSCRHLGYLRNFLAEGDCAAGVVSIVILDMWKGGDTSWTSIRCMPGSSSWIL